MISDKKLIRSKADPIVKEENRLDWRENKEEIISDEEDDEEEDDDEEESGDISSDPE